MLFDFFTHKNLLSISDIRETFDLLWIKVKPDEGMNSFVPKLFDEIKSLSPRDRFEFFFDVNGSSQKITDSSADSYQLLVQHIDNFKDEDESEYEIEITVTKTIKDSTFSIYFIDRFAEYIDEEILLNIFSTISDRFSNFLKLEVFSTINSFGSKSIFFVQAPACQVDDEQISKTSRDDKLDLYFDNCHSPVRNFKLLPNDFFLRDDSPNNKLNSFFHKACATLSLMFISNSSELTVKGLLSYKITGYKTIICNGIEASELAKNYKILFTIYDWAYEGGNSSDKIGLIRNVLSIHLDDTGSILFNNEVWEAIRSNYQIYLKGNIQSYLEVKNKIGEFIIESSTKTYAMAEELLDSLKNNIFIFLTFLVTVVLVNGLKDNGEACIFSNTYLAVVIILSIVSALWLLMAQNELSSRFENASGTIKEILRLNYNKVLMESEINDCVDPIINKNKNYLKSQIKKYACWWIVLLLFFDLSYVAANRYFLPSPAGKDSVKQGQIKKEEIPKESVTEPTTSQKVK